MTRAHLKTRTASTSTVSDTTVAGAALTHAELDSNLINLRDSSWGLADDTSTVLQVSDDKTITVAGGTNITTAISGDTLTINGADLSSYATTSYVDTQDANIASDTLTFTNKTFDVEGTGNSISNIDVADFKAAAIVIESEGIGSNDNDTTIPTSAAVKAYADSVGGGGIITALNNQAENRLVSIGSTTTELDGEANLTFDGTTLTLTGSAALDGITITDNTISTNRSNDDLIINSSGTGRITLSTDGSRLENSITYPKYQGSASRVKGVVLTHELTTNPDTLTNREYGHAIHLGTTLTASSSTNNNFRPRSCIFSSQTDMAGYDYTVAALSRGPVGLFAAGSVNNSSATTASTLATVKGANFSAGVSDYDSPTQDLTINNAFSCYNTVDVDYDGSADITIDNGYNYYATHFVDSGSGGGTATITNNYGYYYTGSGATNNYAFYSAEDTAKSRVGTLQRYREEINALTSDTTISVDCGLAPVHTITLGHNTEFNISSLGTGQTATIIITQDGTGSRTATFGTDGSTAVKFAGGTPTLSTDANAIDVITVFNDGTNYLGNLAQAFAA